MGTASNAITTTRLVYLCDKQVVPAGSMEVATVCGDPLCCRPTHLIPESRKFTGERINCPGFIRSRHYPHMLFQACVHNPNCIKITDLASLTRVDTRKKEIDFTEDEDPEWITVLEEIDVEEYPEYNENFIKEHGKLTSLPKQETPKKTTKTNVKGGGKTSVKEGKKRKIVEKEPEESEKESEESEGESEKEPEESESVPELEPEESKEVEETPKQNTGRRKNRDRTKNQ